MRRAVERKQKKAARKAALRQANQTLPSAHSAAAPIPLPVEPAPAPPVAEPTSQARIDANRANAQHSTGPKSPAGKAASSQNRLTHGLVYTGGNFRVLAGEDQSAFDALFNTLTEEHQPATPSESILVLRMAHHEWLYQPALRLQENCFDPETGKVADAKSLLIYALRLPARTGLQPLLE
jgi:cell wall-associated NlpC family hydrolase